jgi:hypothetical protein
MQAQLPTWLAPSNHLRTGRPVGVPTHELALMSALARDMWRLDRPGPGRVNFVLFEAEVGAGRPDAVVLTVSRNSLEKFRATGLRIPTPTASRALTDTADSSLGISVQYARSLRRRLEAEGWTSREFQQGAAIIHDSLAIEAKVSDWSRALRQVAKFQPTTHRSAILMPEMAATRVPRPTIEKNGIGLLAESHGRTEWMTPAVGQDLSPQRRLWLLELLLRGLDAGVAYNPSALRKRSIAELNASTLGR